MVMEFREEYYEIYVDSQLVDTFVSSENILEALNSIRTRYPDNSVEVYKVRLEEEKVY